MTNKQALKQLTRECKRCSHSWLLRREEEPTICPECKSKLWNKEKLSTPKS